MTTDRPLLAGDFGVEAVAIHGADAESHHVKIRRWGVRLSPGDARRLAHEVLNAAASIDGRDPAFREVPFADRAADAVIASLTNPAFGTGFVAWLASFTGTEQDTVRATIADAIWAQTSPTTDRPTDDETAGPTLAAVQAWLTKIEDRLALVSKTMLATVRHAAEVEAAHHKAAAELDAERAAKAPDPARVYALQAAAQWLSTPISGRAASDVVAAAEAFEAYLREDR